MRAAVLLCFALLAIRAHAAYDVFLQITPVTGPSVTGTVADPLYSGWIKVRSFGASTDKPSTFTQGAVAQEPTRFTTFSLVKEMDAASPNLFQKLTARTALATVKLVIVQRSPARVEMWDMQASQCALQSQALHAFTGDSEITEEISFLTTAFEWSYISTSPAGDPLVESFANFDTAATTGTRGTRAPVFPGGVDTDGDGIPDGWELFYGLDAAVSDATLDPDGDGLDNLHEFIAHTDPRQSQSALRMTALQKVGTSTYLLTWKSVAGLTYRIESAPAPGGPWNTVQTLTSAGNGTTSTTVSGTAPRTFFRAVTP